MTVPAVARFAMPAQENEQEGIHEASTKDQILVTIGSRYLEP
jgi:hypothetical protein